MGIIKAFTHCQYKVWSLASGPAFEKVDDDIDFHCISNIVNNSFFKNYNEAIRLAKIILKRFGYNINSIENKVSLTVPPFWIDMSKLFELYVLGKLKEAIEFKGIIFQPKGEYGYLDFLRTISGNELVIDAKYKLDYKNRAQRREIYFLYAE